MKFINEFDKLAPGDLIKRRKGVSIFFIVESHKLYGNWMLLSSRTGLLTPVDSDDIYNFFEIVHKQ